MRPTLLAHVYRRGEWLYVPTLGLASFGHVDLAPVSVVATGDRAGLPAALSQLGPPDPADLTGGRDERLLAVPLAAGVNSWRTFEKDAVLFELAEDAEGYRGLHIRRLNRDNNRADDNVDRIRFSGGPIEAFAEWIAETAAP